jgi:hypothetical protein
MRCDELSYQTGPTGLMRRTHTAPVIAVEVFKELYVIAEMRVGLYLGILAKHRTATVSIPQKKAAEPIS